MKTINGLRATAFWVQRFLDVRLPMGVVNGPRQRRRCVIDGSGFERNSF